MNLSLKIYMQNENEAQICNADEMPQGDSMEPSEAQPDLEKERIKVLDELRDDILKSMEDEIREKIEGNPAPTDEEARVGAFKEELEPQVRDAVFEFFRKGYSTESSGFYGNGYQAIDGWFEFDDKTKNKIRDIGAEVINAEEAGLPYNGKAWTRIRFSPSEANIESMKNKWDEIARVLPAKEGSQTLSSSFGSYQFREKYVPNWRGRFGEEAILRDLEISRSQSVPDIENIEHKDAELLEKIRSIKQESAEPEKEIEWEIRKLEADRVVDDEGEGIDPDIKETVVAFNAMGLHTSSSCEGHADHGKNAPWIDVEAPFEPRNRYIGEEDIYEEVASKYGVTAEEVRRGINEEASEEAASNMPADETPEYKEWRKENLILGRKVKDFIEEFYEDRDVPHDVRLIVYEWGDSGGSRIHNGGENFVKNLSEVDEEEKARRAVSLAYYREEIRAFGEFLKGKYFSSN